MRNEAWPRHRLERGRLSLRCRNSDVLGAFDLFGLTWLRLDAVGITHLICVRAVQYQRAEKRRCLPVRTAGWNQHWRPFISAHKAKTGSYLVVRANAARIKSILSYWCMNVVLLTRSSACLVPSVPAGKVQQTTVPHRPAWNSVGGLAEAFRRQRYLSRRLYEEHKFTYSGTADTTMSDFMMVAKSSQVKGSVAWNINERRLRWHF